MTACRGNLSSPRAVEVGFVKTSFDYMSFAAAAAAAHSSRLRRHDSSLRVAAPPLVVALPSAHRRLYFESRRCVDFE